MTTPCPTCRGIRTAIAQKFCKACGEPLLVLPVPDTLAQASNAEVERLRMLVLSARDAMNEYHLTKTSKALDELTRIADMCNRPELLDVPYVRSVIEAETAQLRRQLKDAVEVRDQRWQMAKEAKKEVEHWQCEAKNWRDVAEKLQQQVDEMKGQT